MRRYLCGKGGAARRSFQRSIRPKPLLRAGAPRSRPSCRCREQSLVDHLESGSIDIAKLIRPPRQESNRCWPQMNADEKGVLIRTTEFEICARCQDFQATPVFSFCLWLIRAPRRFTRTEAPGPPALRGLRVLKFLALFFSCLRGSVVKFFWLRPRCVPLRLSVAAIPRKWT